MVGSSSSTNFFFTTAWQVLAFDWCFDSAGVSFRVADLARYDNALIYTCDVTSYACAPGSAMDSALDSESEGRGFDPHVGQQLSSIKVSGGIVV